MSTRLPPPRIAAMLLLSTTLIAQTSPPTATPATSPATQPGPLKIQLMDGSILAGKISVPELTMETAYGTLKVPVDQIQAFAPGIKSHPEFESKLNAAIKDLSAEAFGDREKAQEAIVKMGPELRREMERQLKGAESEKQMRLQKILEEFEGNDSDDDAAGAGATSQWTPDDLIVTPTFTIVGKIATPSFNLTSPYGTLQVKLSDIRRAWREGGAPEEVHKSLAVQGNAAAQHQWTSSGVRVNKGDQVAITASGQIQMTPFGNMQSGPDGGPNFGMQPPENIPGGALIARISGGGGKGDVIKVGSKHAFAATKTGVLEFSIAMPGDFGGNQFPGEYQVKVHITKKP